MQFGICTSIDNAPAVKAAGWDYVEDSVQSLLQGQLDDAQWQGERRVKASPLPVPAANLLVPAALKVTGPEANLDRLRSYMTTVLGRAKKVGVTTLVFGSGGARNIPDGFDCDRARKQVLEFIRMAAPIAAKHGVTIVAEPLNRHECNVINSVAEAMSYVKEIDHPNFQCLVDSYHLWLEDEPLKNVEAALPWIKHVHLADKSGRVPPGESGTSDYRELFRVLKRSGYDARISIEPGVQYDIPTVAPRVLEFIKRQWKEA